jgi:shikimate dehydrogenase
LTVAPSARKAAVLGSPIGHSRSPQLHLAAYRALGLTDWSYERIDCTADELPGLVARLGPEWVGLSVTMPNKVAALEFATERTDRAVLAGSANTLVRVDSGWRADCTDVDGVRGALTDVAADGVASFEGMAAVVLGAGGTARPALIALGQLGIERVTIIARDSGRAHETLKLAATLGVPARVLSFNPQIVHDACDEAVVAVSTLPAAAAAPIAEPVAAAPIVLDAIYDPWPTPLARAVIRAGGTVVSGLDMLLNQAFGQVEQFTGLPAPRAAMAAALAGPRM